MATSWDASSYQGQPAGYWDAVVPKPGAPASGYQEYYKKAGAYPPGYQPLYQPVAQQSVAQQSVAQQPQQSVAPGLLGHGFSWSNLLNPTNDPAIAAKLNPDNSGQAQQAQQAQESQQAQQPIYQQVDPMTLINPFYTRQPTGQFDLDPMKMLMQYRVY